MGLLRARRVLYLFLGLYAVALILLIPVKPLGMDEGIDLGGAPLGYLVDYAMIQWFGYSVFVVRLPSVLFTVLTCAGVYMLARQTSLRMPLLAAIFYAVSPLTVRYALEARPYAQAACWSVFSTVVFLALIRQPTFAKAAGYSVLVTAGLYTQPYSISVAVAHLLWLILTYSTKEKVRAVWLAGTAVALASLAFLPWFARTQAAWHGVVNSGDPHELMGTGYIGAALAVIAIAMALKWSYWNKEEKIFWTTYMVIPLLLMPVLAARQLIFVLVPISVLVAVCVDTFCYPGARRWGLLVPAALLVSMIVEDVRLSTG